MDAEFKADCGFWCYLQLLLGWVLVISGILITPLPVPIGLVLLALGLVLLIQRSLFVRRQLRALRTRYPKLSSRLRHAEPRLGRLGSVLRKTDPHRR